MNLIETYHHNAPKLTFTTQNLLTEGIDLTKKDTNGESPLTIASSNFRLDVLSLMKDHGVSFDSLDWSPSYFEVAFGSKDSLIKSAKEHEDIEWTDHAKRTPLVFALQVGELDKAEALVQLGAEPKEMSERIQTLLHQVVAQNRPQVVSWVLSQGIDMEAMDYMGRTALMIAAQSDADKSCRTLLEAGADPDKTNEFEQKAVGLANTWNCAKVFLDFGAEIKDVSEEAIADMMEREERKLGCSEKEFLSHQHRSYGRSNPQLTPHPFWIEMIKTAMDAYQAREQFGASFGEATWCFERFGRSLSVLEDGRIIAIAGEHEDYYDPDFCIYNDVVVFEKGKEPVIYSYPKASFPPTDFHTATLVNNHIYIIGNLGYQHERRVGFTPVFQLNLDNFVITQIQTKGDAPGWIFDHSAKLENGKIHIKGGKLVSENGIIENQQSYSFDIESRTWAKLP